MSKYYCPACPAFFSGENAYKLHLQIAHSSSTKNHECLNCQLKFHDHAQLAVHMKKAHPIGTLFTKTVEQELKAYQESLKKQLSAPTPGWSWVNETGKNKEEKPMDVNTITPSKLGQAKKQRDALRNSVRNDIEKFRDKFGGSQFEVAHAILDVILDQANDYAKSYSKCEMTNDLAQTLLPETKSLIEAAGPAVNLISSVGESKLLTQDQLEKLLNPLLSDGEWKPINKNIVAKTSATMTKSLKLDTQVQLADCAGTTMVYSSKTYPSVKKLINELKATNKDKYFLHGKCFYGYNKAPEGMAQGWNYVIFAMRKNAPYILYTDLKKFSFYAPAGYKWRKLKNKPIYKLVKDTKQVSYWNKRYDKKAAKDTVTVAPALLGVAVPYEDAMSGKYVLPTGAHWETSIANPRHAIAVWTHATNPDGTPKFSSIGAIFPKPEAKSVVCTDSHGVSTPIWPNTAYLAVMTKYAPPVGWVWQKDITSHSVQLVKSTG